MNFEPAVMRKLERWSKEENEEELEIELKPKKKKKPKKPKRVIPLEQKYTLTGIGTTSLLLIAMIIQLLMSGE